MKLDGSEAKQLGSLSWDMGIEKGTGKKTNSQPLEVTHVMQEGRYCLQGQSSSALQHVECHGKRYPVCESDVLAVIYRDSNNKQSLADSDQVHCTQSMWQKFVQTMPLSYWY